METTTTPRASSAVDDWASYIERQLADQSAGRQTHADFAALVAEAWETPDPDPRPIAGSLTDHPGVVHRVRITAYGLTNDYADGPLYVSIAIETVDGPRVVDHTRLYLDPGDDLSALGIDSPDRLLALLDADGPTLEADVVYGETPDGAITTHFANPRWGVLDPRDIEEALG